MTWEMWWSSVWLITSRKWSGIIWDDVCLISRVISLYSLMAPTRIEKRLKMTMMKLKWRRTRMMSEICIYAGIKGRVGFAAYINYAPIEVNTYFGNSPGT